jgi:hypothetical protein
MIPDVGQLCKIIIDGTEQVFEARIVAFGLGLGGTEVMFLDTGSPVELLMNIHTGERQPFRWFGANSRGIGIELRDDAAGVGVNLAAFYHLPQDFVVRAGEYVEIGRATAIWL